MAVLQISGVHHYIGSSSDDKPTSGVPAGSTFLAITAGDTPTMRVWYFDGTAWAQEVVGGDELDTNLLVPRVMTGEAVIDEGEADWTDPQDLIVITPAADSPLSQVYLDLDMAHASTGFAAGYTTEELTLAVHRKVDGTNWRLESSQTITGTAAAGRSIRLSLGTVGEDEEVKITAELDAEADGSEVADIPYALAYIGALAPTVTAAEAGA